MRSRSTLLATTLVALALGAPSTAPAAGPTAVAVGTDGSVYAGFASGAVKRHRGADGVALSTWQTQVADEDGSLGGIVALDGSAAGGVWALDANRRVQEFTRDGAFVRGFRLGPCESSNDPVPGSKGGLEVTGTAVYVAHPCANTLERFALGDLPAGGTGTPPSIGAGVFAPHGIAAPLSDTAAADTQALYVTQPLSSAIRRFDLATLAQVGDAVPITHTGSPEDVHLSGEGGQGRILVSEAANADPGYAHRIYAFGAAGGGSFPELFNFGGLGTEPGRLNNAVAIEGIGTAGGLATEVVVADRSNERLQRLTATTSDNGNVVWVASAQDPGPPPAPGPETVPAVAGPATRGPPALRGSRSTPGRGTPRSRTSSSPWTSRGAPSRSRSPTTPTSTPGSASRQAPTESSGGSSPMIPTAFAGASSSASRVRAAVSSATRSASTAAARRSDRPA